MINTSLNKNYNSGDRVTRDFSPVPEGIYDIRVKAISDWVENKKDIKVIMRDENGRNIKDENGKNVTEMHKDLKFYNCRVDFEVVGGEHEGKVIFYNLTTHPNMDFAIPNFLWGLGITDCNASDIQKVCIGKIASAEITQRTWEKTVQNKDTGVDEIEERIINDIKNFKAPLKFESVNKTSDNDDLDF